MKDIWQANKEKVINKKKIIIFVIVLIIIALIISSAILYICNKTVRDWIDKNIYRKEVMQDKATTIELKDENSNIYAFNKYIGILNKSEFTIYNNTGSKEKSLEVQVSNPIFDSANRFLVIAENKGKKLYVISDKEEVWNAQVDGDIAQVHINKNGYVAVVIVNTSYKTVIVMYDPQGKELFKTYLSSTRTADVSISNDNKYLAIAEVDTSGSIIQSNIKVISVEKASSDPTSSLENTYQGEGGKLITNIKYQDKNKLVCMYTDSITVIENGKENSLVENKNKKTIFQSIELLDNAISIEEKSSGLFTADSIVNIINIGNKNSKEYVANSITKEIYISEDIIGLNLGTEIEFINKDGWLVKRYLANQEITNIVVSNSIAGIIYRDKIEIVNL